MDNSKFVIKLEFKGKEELQQLIAQIGKQYNIPVDIDISTAKLGVFKDFENRLRGLSQTAVNFTSHIGFAIQGIKQMYGALDKVFGTVIRTSSEFEQLRIRLFSLYQDTDRATAAFEKFRKVALDTPATLRQVVEAGANLKAFGLDAENVLESVQDLAAYMGIDIVEAANAVGRAFAGGAGAAIILRERGILELIRSFHGIDDLTKLSLPEFREAMLSTFKSAEVGIAASSARMADSYAGAMAQMQDAMDMLYANIGDNFTPVIAGAGNADAVRDLTEKKDYDISQIRQKIMQDAMELLYAKIVDNFTPVIAVAGCADAVRDLTEKKDYDISQIRQKMQEKNEKDEAAYYEKLKFYADGYYQWKEARIKKEATQSNSPQSWIDDQIALLNSEQQEWDQRAILSFEQKYDAEMMHLAQLKNLGIATYYEIAQKSWEYYHALKAILEADRELTEEEKALLAIYEKRAQKAQLAVNKENAENKTLIGYLLDSIGVPEEQQDKVKSTFQNLANQISSIFSQMYNNLASQRDKALADLEKRAKTERKTNAWLAKEKERINEEYEKKQRSLKRTEQKMQIASATVNTLEGITNALTIKPAWLAPVLAASIGALGFAQVKLIAEQKFASGGLFRGKGTPTSDSNLIAVSDNEYIVSAERVNRFGVPFFDALNFGNAEHIRKALNAIKIPTFATLPIPSKTSGYATGGHVPSAHPNPANIQMNVTLKCNDKVLAKAVARGNKKIIST